MNAKISPTFTPLNRLEEVLIEAQQGRLDRDRFFRTLLDSRVFLPSATPCKASNGASSDVLDGVTPLVFERNRTTMCAVFTDPRRQTQYGDLVRYTLPIICRELLGRMNNGNGIVLNPGYSAGLEVSPEAGRALLKQFS